MRTFSRLSFALCASGMAISALYAWIDFGVTLFSGLVYPFLLAIVTFGAAALLTIFGPPRGARQAMMLSGAALAIPLIVIVYVLLYASGIDWDQTWLGSRMIGGSPFAAAGTIALFWAATIAFWVAGATSVSWSGSYPSVCRRFDHGISALFALLFAKMVIRFSIHLETPEHLSDWMIVPYVVFGVATVAMARNRSGGRKTVASSREGVTAATVFGVAIFAAALLVLPFTAYLRSGSERAYARVSEDATPWFEATKRGLNEAFQVVPLKMSHLGGSTRAHISEDDASIEEVQRARAVTGLILAGVLGIFGWQAWRWWRAQRFRSNAGSEGLTRMSEAWADWLRSSLRGLKATFTRSTYSLPGARYRALVRWGERSGVKKRVDETPNEYGARLKARFDSISPEIDVLVASYNRVVYAKKPLDEATLARNASAWRRLASPARWPMRLRAWLASG